MNLWAPWAHVMPAILTLAAQLEFWWEASGQLVAIWVGPLLGEGEEEEEEEG